MSTVKTKRLSIFKAQTNAAFRLLKQMGFEQKEEAYCHWQNITHEIQDVMEKARKECMETTIGKEPEKDNFVKEKNNENIETNSNVTAANSECQQEIVSTVVALVSEKSPKAKKLQSSKSPVKSHLTNQEVEPRRSARKSKPNKLFEDSIVDLKSLSKALGEDNLSEEEETKVSNSKSVDSSYVIIKKNPKLPSEEKAPYLSDVNEEDELTNTKDNESVPKDTDENQEPENVGQEETQPKSVYRPRRKNLTKEELKNACKCKVCGKRLANRSNLNVHMRTHNGEKPYCCKECKRSFSTKPNLLRHIRTHTGEKPYECPECKKRFIEKKAMDVHRRCHTGEKPYECKICKKQFSQPGTLQTHMHVHTGYKGFSCEKCEKSFRQRSQLKIHLLRHENIKNHTCSHDGCGMAFVSKAELIRHMIRHTGERAFLCKDCPKSFTRLQYLREHASTHNGKNTMKCDICSETFTMARSYNRHMQKHEQIPESNSMESEEENSQPTMVYVIQSNADSGRSEKTMVVPQELIAQKSTESNTELQPNKTGPTPIAKVSDLQQAGLQIIQHVDANGQVQYTIVDPNSGDNLDNEETYQLTLSNILNQAQFQTQNPTDTILIQGEGGESMLGVRGSDGTVYIQGNQSEDALIEMAPIPDHEALTGSQDQVQNRTILEEDEDNSERIPQTVHEVSGMITANEDAKEDIHQGTVVTQTYVNEDYSDLSAIKMLVSSTEQQ